MAGGDQADEGVGTFGEVGNKSMIGDGSMGHLHVRGSLGRCGVADFGRRTPPIFTYLRPTLELDQPCTEGVSAGGVRL